MQRFFIGLGQKQTYDLNGVRYEVSSRFVKDKVESKNTIRNRVERILQEERVSIVCSYMLMHFLYDEAPFAFLHIEG